MAKFSTEARLGVFVIVGFAILVWGTMKVTQLGEKGGYELTAVFDDASGLDINAPVRMVGVNVGRVKAIDVFERRARVTMIVEDRFSVDRDASMSIKNQGILGDKYIQIEPGTAKNYYRPGDTVVNTRSSVDLDKLFQSLESAGRDLSGLLSSLRKVFASSDGEKSLSQILKNTRDLSVNLNRMVLENQEKVNRILSNVERLSKNLNAVALENREQFRMAISNIRQVSENLRNDLPALTSKLGNASDEVTGIISENREKIKSTIERIQRDSEILGTTLESVRSIADRIESGQGTVGKLINEKEVYNNLNETLKGISKAVKKKDAIKLKWDFYGHYLETPDTFKGYGRLDIIPQKNKFYRLELVDDSEGKRTWRNITTTTTTGGTTTISQTKEVKNEDILKLSVEFGRRYTDTALRIGYIESSFGVGVDQFAMNDNLRFTLDAFDFSRDENPHLTAYLAYKFMNYFHVDLGVDDIINNVRDPGILVGLGLTFRDDDIKYILGNAGIP
ncbi:MAG TPA: MCE family protein [Proteobacteria bacterium]|nr:putative phospholipid ABC transporter-binding protein MlaD [bacterium BMS3Abin14]HDL54020.1 MCE family protein [Pseudomonadota bacterium]